MFFLLCVCECSLTSAKSVQPDLFKVSVNEASIKGESKASFTGPEASVTALERNTLTEFHALTLVRSLCYGLGNLPDRLVFSLHSDNSKVSLLLSTMHKSKIRINR